jgi:hypothetical protein
MRVSSIAFSAVLLILFGGIARGQKIAPAESPLPSAHGRVCAAEPTKISGDQPAVDLGQLHANPQNNLIDLPANETTEQPVLHIDQDLALLREKIAELGQCIRFAEAQGSRERAQGHCSETLLLNFEMRHDGEAERDIPIGHVPGNAAFFYESGMTIDADGAPNAYHPDNSGIDDLGNAGAPGVWEGLAKDAHGEPFIQGPSDPFPGYYVSETALADRSKAISDPARYVDASRIPFMVLPGGLARELGARVGDFALVFNERNGRSSYAIFGDVGPTDRIGEGSVALAENLGIHSDARNGGTWRGVLYLVFPGSGEGRPKTVEEINEHGQALLRKWESEMTGATCTALNSSSPSARGN